MTILSRPIPTNSHKSWTVIAGGHNRMLVQKRTEEGLLKNLTLAHRLMYGEVDLFKFRIIYTTSPEDFMGVYAEPQKDLPPAVPPSLPSSSSVTEQKGNGNRGSNGSGAGGGGRGSNNEVTTVYGATITAETVALGLNVYPAGAGSGSGAGVGGAGVGGGTSSSSRGGGGSHVLVTFGDTFLGGGSKTIMDGDRRRNRSSSRINQQQPQDTQQGPTREKERSSPKAVDSSTTENERYVVAIANSVEEILFDWDAIKGGWRLQGGGAIDIATWETFYQGVLRFTEEAAEEEDTNRNDRDNVNSGGVEDGHNSNIGRQQGNNQSSSHHSSNKPKSGSRDYMDASSDEDEKKAAINSRGGGGSQLPRSSHLNNISAGPAVHHTINGGSAALSNNTTRSPSRGSGASTPYLGPLPLNTPRRTPEGGTASSFVDAGGSATTTVASFAAQQERAYHERILRDVEGGNSKDPSDEQHLVDNGIAAGPSGEEEVRRVFGGAADFDSSSFLSFSRRSPEGGVSRTSSNQANQRGETITAGGRVGVGIGGIRFSLTPPNPSSFANSGNLLNYDPHHRDAKGRGVLGVESERISTEAGPRSHVRLVDASVGNKITSSNSEGEGEVIDGFVDANALIAKGGIDLHCSQEEQWAARVAQTFAWGEVFRSTLFLCLFLHGWWYQWTNMAVLVGMVAVSGHALPRRWTGRGTGPSSQLAANISSTTQLSTNVSLPEDPTLAWASADGILVEEIASMRQSVAALRYFLRSVLGIQTPTDVRNVLVLGVLTNFVSGALFGPQYTIVSMSERHGGLVLGLTMLALLVRDRVLLKLSSSSFSHESSLSNAHVSSNAMIGPNDALSKAELSRASTRGEHMPLSSLSPTVSSSTKAAPVAPSLDHHALGQPPKASTTKNKLRSSSPKQATPTPVFDDGIDRTRPDLRTKILLSNFTELFADSWTFVKERLGVRWSDRPSYLCNKRMNLYTCVFDGCNSATVDRVLNDDPQLNKGRAANAHKYDRLLTLMEGFGVIEPHSNTIGIHSCYKSPILGISARDVATQLVAGYYLTVAEQFALKVGLGRTTDENGRAAPAYPEGYVPHVYVLAAIDGGNHGGHGTFAPIRGFQRAAVHRYLVLAEDMPPVGGQTYSTSVRFTMLVNMDPQGKIPASLLTATNDEQIDKVALMRKLCVEMGSIPPERMGEGSNSLCAAEGSLHGKGPRHLDTLFLPDSMLTPAVLERASAYNKTERHAVESPEREHKGKVEVVNRRSGGRSSRRNSIHHHHRPRGLFTKTDSEALPQELAFCVEYAHVTSALRLGWVRVGERDGVVLYQCPSPFNNDVVLSSVSSCNKADYEEDTTTKTAKGVLRGPETSPPPRSPSSLPHPRSGAVSSTTNNMIIAHMSSLSPSQTSLSALLSSTSSPVFGLKENRPISLSGRNGDERVDAEQAKPSSLCKDHTAVRYMVRIEGANAASLERVLQEDLLALSAPSSAEEKSPKNTGLFGALMKNNKKKSESACEASSYGRCNPFVVSQYLDRQATNILSRTPEAAVEDPSLVTEDSPEDDVPSSAVTSCCLSEHAVVIRRLLDAGDGSNSGSALRRQCATATTCAYYLSPHQQGITGLLPAPLTRAEESAEDEALSARMALSSNVLMQGTIDISRLVDLVDDAQQGPSCLSSSPSTCSLSQNGNRAKGNGSDLTTPSRSRPEDSRNEAHYAHYQEAMIKGSEETKGRSKGLKNNNNNNTGNNKKVRVLCQSLIAIDDPNSAKEIEVNTTSRWWTADERRGCTVATSSPASPQSRPNSTCNAALLTPLPTVITALVPTACDLIFTSDIDLLGSEEEEENVVSTVPVAGSTSSSSSTTKRAAQQNTATSTSTSTSTSTAAFNNELLLQGFVSLRRLLLTVGPSVPMYKSGGSWREGPHPMWDLFGSRLLLPRSRLQERGRAEDDDGTHFDAENNEELILKSMPVTDDEKEEYDQSDDTRDGSKPKASTTASPASALLTVYPTRQSFLLRNRATPFDVCIDGASSSADNGAMVSISYPTIEDEDGSVRDEFSSVILLSAADKARERGSSNASPSTSFISPTIRHNRIPLLLAPNPYIARHSVSEAILMLRELLIKMKLGSAPSATAAPLFPSSSLLSVVSSSSSSSTAVVGGYSWSSSPVLKKEGVVVYDMSVPWCKRKAFKGHFFMPYVSCSALDQALNGDGGQLRGAIRSSRNIQGGARGSRGGGGDVDDGIILESARHLFGGGRVPTRHIQRMQKFDRLLRDRFELVSSSPFNASGSPVTVDNEPNGIFPSATLTARAGPLNPYSDAKGSESDEGDGENNGHAWCSATKRGRTGGDDENEKIVRVNDDPFITHEHSLYASLKPGVAGRDYVSRVAKRLYFTNESTRTRLGLSTLLNEPPSSTLSLPSALAGSFTASASAANGVGMNRSAGRTFVRVATDNHALVPPTNGYLRGRLFMEGFIGQDVHVVSSSSSAPSSSSSSPPQQRPRHVCVGYTYSEYEVDGIASAMKDKRSFLNTVCGGKDPRRYAEWKGAANVPKHLVLGDEEGREGGGGIALVGAQKGSPSSLASPTSPSSSSSMQNSGMYGCLVTYTISCDPAGSISQSDYTSAMLSRVVETLLGLFTVAVELQAEELKGYSMASSSSLACPSEA